MSRNATNRPMLVCFFLTDVVAERNKSSLFFPLFIPFSFFLLPFVRLIFKSKLLHNTEADERRRVGGKKDNSKQVLFIDSLFLFSLWPGPDAGVLATSEFIPHSLKWWHTPGFVVAVYCVLTFNPIQWHIINYYTRFFVHTPSLVSPGDIFCSPCCRGATVGVLVTHSHFQGAAAAAYRRPCPLPLQMSFMGRLKRSLSVVT